MQTSFLSTFVAVGFLTLSALAGESASNSEKYGYFNSPSPEREAFALSQNGRVNSRLQKSRNRKAITSYFMSEMAKEQTLFSKRLPIGTLQMIDRGLSKPQELILKAADGTEQVLFSSFQIKKDNRVRGAGYRLSPDKSKLAMVFRTDGSRDFSSIYVIDLTNRKLIVERQNCDCQSNQVVWRSDSEIYFADKDAAGNGIVNSLKITDASAVVSKVYEGYEFGETPTSKLILLINSTENKNLIFRPNQVPIEVSGVDLSDYDYIDFNLGSIYFSADHAEDGVSSTALFKVDEATGAFSMIKDFVGNIKIRALTEKGVVLSETDGMKSNAVFYSFEKKSIQSLTLPEFVSLQFASDTEDQNVIALSVMSDLVEDRTLNWNLTSNTADFGDNFKKEMLESENLSLDVSFKMVPSFDGSLIPVKIVSKKDVPLVDRPVYMEVYGGFGIAATFEPYHDVKLLDFVKRGGLIVAPALRGGDELGEAWHQAAKKENKIKTYEDLAATAKYLIDNGISKKNKIAILGGSNGGLTVAATGLLFPQYFGLVVATNGVLDMLGKDTLDARYNGWRGEYGDARKAEDATYLAKISPLENVALAENGPAFLIVNGRHDTRVNPAHSMKFVKAAEDLRLAGKNVNVEMVAMNNSGHPVSADENDFIALRTLVVVWSRIFDDFGMNF